MPLTVKHVEEEINRPVVVAQVSEGNFLLRLVYFPDTKLYEVSCYKDGEEMKQYEYKGRVSLNAVGMYNAAYNTEIKNR